MTLYKGTWKYIINYVKKRCESYKKGRMFIFKVLGYADKKFWLPIGECVAYACECVSATKLYSKMFKILNFMHISYNEEEDSQLPCWQLDITDISNDHFQSCKTESDKENTQ